VISGEHHTVERGKLVVLSRGSERMRSAPHVIVRTRYRQFATMLIPRLLERPVGTSAIIRNQLRRLIDESAVDHITVRVLLKVTGASLAAG